MKLIVIGNAKYATLLITARDWHFQAPEIENVLGWGKLLK
jgi:hypothetical protein